VATRARVEAAKRLRERNVLRAAAIAGRVELNLRSLRSLSPPKPDVSCRINGTPVYVELTQMAHARSANQMAAHVAALNRGSDPAPLIDTYDDRAALRDALRRKAGKHYDSAGRPLYLLVWIDGFFHPGGMPSPWARRILRAQGPESRWSTIWVYDATRKRLVAQWQRRRSRRDGAG
jgi:hypothetical protein